MKAFINTKDGHCYYRTRLIRSYARAKSFCKCLTANTRFRAVSVLQSNQGNGYYVQYQPSNPARYSELYHRQYRQRELKGAAEQPGYTWNLQTRGLNAWYLCQSISGESYEVTEASCGCPDWQYRGRKSGLPCKHIHAYSCAAAAQEIRQLTLIRLDLRFGRPATQTPVPSVLQTPVPVPVQTSVPASIGERVSPPRSTLAQRFAAAGLRPDLDFP